MIPPVTSELLQGWLHTSYWVEPQRGAEPLRLRLGEPSSAMSKLHARCAESTSVLVTAWNPYSRCCGQPQNRVAQAALRDHLDALGMRCLKAMARPDADWPAEPGLLVLGADADFARALCRRFLQHATVVFAADAVPRLVLHPDVAIDVPIAQMPWILA